MTFWQNLSTKANHSISPGTFNISIKKCLAKKCSLLPHFPRHFFHKKCLEKKCSLHPHYPRHFQNVQKKCLAKKCSLYPHIPRHKKKCFLLPHFPRHLIFLLQLHSSPVTLHLWRKKCLGKKSAWDAASQHPAYYAGLIWATFCSF